MSTRALVLDPDPDNRHRLGLLLKKAGFEPVLCDTGTSAARVLKTDVFDVAIINSTMRDMPVVDAARRLRRVMESENFGPYTRIVCIIFDKREMKSFPPHLIDAFLVAPFSAEDFKNAVGGKAIVASPAKKSEAQTFTSTVIRS